MSDIVKERRRTDGGPCLRGYPISLAEPIENPGREMHCTETVCESGVFRSLICEIGEPELSYSPESLELRGINEVDEQTPLRGRCVDLNDVVYGISVISR